MRAGTVLATDVKVHHADGDGGKGGGRSRPCLPLHWVQYLPTHFVHAFAMDMFDQMLNIHVL